jgi:hypothetical protein
MEQHYKDFLLARILAGYDRITIHGKVYKICNPNIDIVYEANEIYLNTLEEAQDADIYSDDDIYELLCDRELWSPNEEEMLNKTLPELIPEFQKKMFETRYNVTEREKNRGFLQKTRDKQAQLHLTRHQYDNYTYHGLAAQAKYHFLILHSTYEEDGTPCRWDHFLVNTVVEKCNSNIIASEHIRELSHTPPWMNQWHALKISRAKICDNITDMTSAQQSLLLFSKMYDNIQESHEPPEDFVVDDDDLLDGWILSQKEKREQEAAEREGRQITKKDRLANADEVFVIPKSLDPEEIERINKMNSPVAQSIKKNRIKEINQRGQIDYKNFSDVKHRMISEFNKKEQK